MKIIHYACDECQREFAVLEEGDDRIHSYFFIPPIEIEHWPSGGRYESFSICAKHLCSSACVRRALEDLARKVEAGATTSSAPNRDEAALAFAAGMGGLIPDGGK